MIVDVIVWRWTMFGMRTTSYGVADRGYIAVWEAKRLLEEAHARGKREGQLAGVLPTETKP